MVATGTLDRNIAAAAANRRRTILLRELHILQLFCSLEEINISFRSLRALDT
jgi:hypothetical protein